MNKPTFFFYDLETSGLSPREDRIMQFAGQRTDLDLNPIGGPVNLLVKLPDDTLPSPSAIAVTKITPQKTLADGITEAEFAKLVTSEIFTPNTIAVGYNTVRFDDEFMRHLFWRTFYDPYEFEWKDGRSRWDLLDVVRMTRALRPEGINWPVTADGKATNRLELITKLNQISHENDVKKIVNLDDKRPFVYSSGRYSSKTNKTTVAFPLTSSRNGNILVYDLRYNLEENLNDKERKSFYPVVKEFYFNRCPAVAPLSVLDKADGWQKIDLDAETVNKNLEILLKHPEFAEKMREEIENKPEFPPAIDPESALYDGFLNDRDRIRCEAVRNADANSLADFNPDFIDERLHELVLHYKAKNVPQSLSDAESKKWQAYRRARLERQAPIFLEELEKIEDDYLKEELKLYFESLNDSDYL